MKRWCIRFLKYSILMMGFVLGRAGYVVYVNPVPLEDEVIEVTDSRFPRRSPAGKDSVFPLKNKKQDSPSDEFPLSRRSTRAERFSARSEGVPFESEAIGEAARNENVVQTSFVPEPSFPGRYVSTSGVYGSRPSGPSSETSTPSSSSSAPISLGAGPYVGPEPVTANGEERSGGGSGKSRGKYDPPAEPYISEIDPVLQGGETVSLNYLVAKGSTEIILEQSLDGGLTFTEVNTLSSESGSFTWTAPGVDVPVAILRITSKKGDLTSELLSDEFSIDSTPPATPAASLVSPVVTNSRTVSFDLLDCNDTNSILVKLDSGQPSENDPGWVSCQTTGNASELSLGAEGPHTFYVFAMDEAGNVSASGAAVGIIYDSIPPVSLNVELDSSELTTSPTALFSSSDCSDTPYVMLSSSSTMPSAADPGWDSCSTVSGDLSYSLSGSDGTYEIFAFTKDPAGNVSLPKPFSVNLDRQAPVLTSVIVNPSITDPTVGDEYTSTVFVSVLLRFSEINPGASYHVQNANASNDCVLTAPEWIPLSGQGAYEADHGFQVSSGDGVKKVCVWARDQVGNISSMSSAQGTEGIDVDTIKLEIGNPPEITSFVVENASDHSHDASSGDMISITWSIQDVEGLNNNPVTLEYTTDNSTWTLLKDSSNHDIINYGGLSGYPLTYDSGLVVPAPSSGYFRLRMKVIDRAGNDALTAYSASFNTSPWEIYAGSFDTGIGLSATATLLRATPNYIPGVFDFNPVTGDLYALDNDAIVKIDIRTGKSSVFLPLLGSTTNLPDNGVLDKSVHHVRRHSLFRISKDGIMYLSHGFGPSGYDSGNVYRINLATFETELFIAAGTDYTNLNDPYNLNWVWATMTMDDEGSIYGLVVCNSTPAHSTTSSYKLIKITKDRVISHIAGNCTRTHPFSSGSGPIDAKTNSLGQMTYPTLGDIAVKDGGKVIVYSIYGRARPYKIVDGQLYDSSLAISNSSRLGFSPKGELYVMGGGIQEVSISETDATDTALRTIVGDDYTLPNCQDDGKLASESCGLSYFRPAFSKSGQMMFAEGPIVNGGRSYRIRYFNSEDRRVTFAGTSVIYGQGMDKSVFRGSITSIDYQTNPNSDFQEGLYIASDEAVSAYYIDAFTNVLSRILGNEVGLGGSGLNNQVINHETNLGAVYSAGNDGGLFKFADDGYPYMRILRGKLYKILSGKIGKAEMNGTTSWDNLTPGSDPINGTMNIFAGTHNLALKGEGLFIMGVGTVNNTTGITSGNNSSSLRFMDFETNQVVHIMGGNGTNAYSPDVLVDSDLRSLNINTYYSSSNLNFTVYDKNTDRLYFVENSKKLRYITAPGSHNSKLITLIDLEGTADTLRNFTIRPDSSALFYVKSGRIFCYNLGSSAPACDNTTMLGPTDGLPTLPALPNQLTWKDNNTLFVSDGRIVMKYNVPF